ncbi:hypothetical protein P7K49_035968, partial [Saguinus oedipus]
MRAKAQADRGGWSIGLDLVLFLNDRATDYAVLEIKRQEDWGTADWRGSLSLSPEREAPASLRHTRGDDLCAEPGPGALSRRCAVAGCKLAY